MAGDAFGNALGSSVVGMATQGSQQEAKLPMQGVGPYSAGDYVNGMDLQSDNAYRNRQSQPYFDQIVGTFGGQPGPDRRNDVLVAGGDKLRLTGVASDADDEAYYAGIIAKAQARDAQRQAAIASTGAQATASLASRLYASGAGDVRGPFYSPDVTGAFLDDLTGPSIGALHATSGMGTYDDPRVGSEMRVVGQRESGEPTTGSALLDAGLVGTTGTLLGGAGIIHGGAQFASDQFWALGNAMSGGWLAGNSSVVQDAVGRNAARGQSLMNLPGQAAGMALRAATGNWYGAVQGIGSALQLDQIAAAEARGDHLGAQVLRTQSAIGVAGVAMGGAGVVRAGAAAAGVSMRLPAATAQLVAPQIPVFGSLQPPIRASRPSWRLSELDLEAMYGQSGYTAQASFLRGRPVSHGAPGSTRPDLYAPGQSIDIKNYNLANTRGQGNLVRDVVAQAQHRSQNLPVGDVQKLVLDARGQNVSTVTLNRLAAQIQQRSNGLITTQHVTFWR